MNTKAAAEAIVADLYLNHGCMTDQQYQAEAYRRRLVVNIVSILDQCEEMDRSPAIQALRKKEPHTVLLFPKDVTLQVGEARAMLGTCSCKECAPLRKVADKTSAPK